MMTKTLVLVVSICIPCLGSAADKSSNSAGLNGTLEQIEINRQAITGTRSTLDSVQLPKGPSGVPGPAGPPGPNGSDGANGKNGSDGSAGARGAAGLPGDPGAKGPVGLDGLEGEPGYKGWNGQDGDAGPKGLSGAPGESGPDGDATSNRDADVCHLFFTLNRFYNATLNVPEFCAQYDVEPENQRIEFIVTAPQDAVIGGEPYRFDVSATSGLDVDVKVDPVSAQVCVNEGDRVSFVGIGDCIVSYEQSGDFRFDPAPSRQETFSVTYPKDCRQTLAIDPESADGVYLIDPLRQGAFEAYCDMTYEGGGWTLALKADGQQRTFSYNSARWTDGQPFNADKPGLDQNEAKLDSFHRVAFSEVAMGLGLNRVSFKHEAASLHQIFTRQNQTPIFGVPVAQWIYLLPGAEKQANCNLSGFNLMESGGLRIGLQTNNEHNCGSIDHRLGIGLPEGMQFSVGNLLSCCGENVGFQAIPAFGTLFVR